MRIQIEELRSKIDRNKAFTKEANLKSEFWGKASEALDNNSLVLELRSTFQVEPILIIYANTVTQEISALG